MAQVISGLVLASASPRRLDLLKSINIIPELIQASEIDESYKKKENPISYCKRLAKEKGDFVFNQFPTKNILSADTSVICGRKIFGKPRDHLEAKKFLNFFSGRKHTVVTAIYLKNEKFNKLKIVSSKVTFKKLDQNDIHDYLQTDEWKNKAGAYAIQGYAERFVKTLNGSYSNVVGLPLYQVFNLLKSANLV